MVAAAVVVVVAVAVGVALVLARHGQSATPSAQRSAPAASATGAGAPTTAASPVVSVSRDSQEARFRVVQAGAVVELAPVSSCWVQIRMGSATGQVVFTGTMRQGDRRALPAGQPVWLRIGNPPGMAIEVNGSPLAISEPANSQPFNVVFDQTS